MAAFFLTILSGLVALLGSVALYGWAYYLELPQTLLHFIMFGGVLGVLAVMLVEAIATRHIGAGGYMTAFYIGLLLLLALVLPNAKLWLSAWEWVMT